MPTAGSRRAGKPDLRVMVAGTVPLYNDEPTLGKVVTEIRGEAVMVERKIELRRRRKRGAKLGKYKAKLAAAKTGGDKDAILAKIHRISPWWVEPAPAK